MHFSLIGDHFINSQTFSFYHVLALQSFRFWDEDDYMYEIFSVLSSEPREPSFWREKVVAVVILLRGLARMSQWRKQNIKF